VKGIRNVLFRANDNIFVCSTTFSISSAFPFINGLSDHDDQYLTTNNIAAAHQPLPLKQRTIK
jgi:hypothetical protein